jgi:hypothetical protein
MLKMFAEYQALVLAEYQNKMESGVLSSRLINPTPANLRDECVSVCNERFQKKDERILRDFFGQQRDAKGYAQAIEEYQVNKFKPLHNFMKGQIAKPDERNVELLAWLIDFKLRPWQLGWTNQGGAQNAEKERGQQTNSLKEKEKDLPGEQLVNDNAESTAKLVESKSLKGQKRGLRRKDLTMLLLLFLLLGGAGYILYVKTTSRLNRQEGCMYWAGDHYERISCGQSSDYTNIVPFNTEKFQNFRRITQEDTITYSSIGKVWYIKVSGKLEFYTSGGRHPKNNQLWLKPITPYIIKKYIIPESK